MIIDEVGEGEMFAAIIPSDNFKASLLSYEGKLSDVGAVKYHMGAYYPEAWYCSKTGFETLGAEDCRSVD